VNMNGTVLDSEAARDSERFVQSMNIGLSNYVLQLLLLIFIVRVCFVNLMTSV
jgi:hypothetical protein